MSRNDITGDRIASRPASDEFRAAFDRIFGEAGRIRAPGMCRCSFSKRALGDGCDVCNPELAARCAAENLEDGDGDE